MKSVLITGANKGIGLETAKQLSDKGLFVYLGSRDLEKGNAVVKKLQEKGFENIRAIQIDVTREETVMEARDTIEKSRAGWIFLLIMPGSAA